MAYVLLLARRCRLSLRACMYVWLANHELYRHCTETPGQSISQKRSRSRKMRTPPALPGFLLLLLLAASSSATSGGYGGAQPGGHGEAAEGLDARYYNRSCPDMERIVQTAVKKAIAGDHTLAPALIRLFFHDFAVRGTDASVLIDAEGSERYAAASRTLRGFELIEDIKAEVERRCPRTVSCADILAAAARDASTEAGAGYWSLRYGRKDGRESRGEEADRYVPMGRESVTDLVAFFQSRGLSILDLVVLSGAHTIGRATCGAVKPRLCSNHTTGHGGGNGGGALDARYAGFLRRKCRRGDGERVELDGETPTGFDSRYYVNLLHGMGLLETDQALLPDSRTGPYVRTLAGGQQPGLFARQFAHSMRRLGDLQVLTAGEGEVRLKCSKVNDDHRYH